MVGIHQGMYWCKIISKFSANYVIKNTITTAPWWAFRNSKIDQVLRMVSMDISPSCLCTDSFWYSIGMGRETIRIDLFCQPWKHILWWWWWLDWKGYDINFLAFSNSASCDTKGTNFLFLLLTKAGHTKLPLLSRVKKIHQEKIGTIDKATMYGCLFKILGDKKGIHS